MSAWQALLLIGAAGAVAAWLFLIKIRPPRVNVASLLFWRRVLDQKRDETWWERVRRAVSLAATVLIAVALAMAVARPGPRTASSSRGKVLIVLDSSWSMLASTSGGTRWDRAVREARALAASAGGDDIALATTADGLVEGPTSDLALIETALDRLAPTGGATAPWPRVGGADTVHFLTDGAHMRSLDRSVVVHSVYEAAANAAITAFDARPIPSGGEAAAEAYLEIVNYAPKEQQVRVTITRGPSVVFDQPVKLAAGETVRQVAPLAAAGGPRLLAKITAAADALDDRQRSRGVDSGRRAADRRRGERKGQRGRATPQTGSVGPGHRDVGRNLSARQGRRRRLRSLGAGDRANAPVADRGAAARVVDSTRRQRRKDSALVDRKHAPGARRRRSTHAWTSSTPAGNCTPRVPKIAAQRRSRSRSAAHRSSPSSISPIAAPWCLALR